MLMELTHSCQGNSCFELIFFVCFYVISTCLLLRHQHTQCLVPRRNESLLFAGIVSKFCFYCQANLSKLINFTYDFESAVGLIYLLSVFFLDTTKIFISIYLKMITGQYLSSITLVFFVSKMTVVAIQMSSWKQTCTA